jgi:hypothetical protein
MPDEFAEPAAEIDAVLETSSPPLHNATILRETKVGRLGKQLVEIGEEGLSSVERLHYVLSVAA